MEPPNPVAATPGGKSKEPFAQALLHLAHPDNEDEAVRIFKEKVQHREIDFVKQQPTEGAKNPKDGRARRREARIKKKQAKANGKPSNKPNPLSAKEKRKLQVYDIPKDARKYSIYEPLNQLWVGYMQEILRGSLGNGGVAGQAAAAKICAADFHGCEMEVVRNRCPSRVGIKGIVVKDTKMTFVIITKKNEIKHVPKEHSVFRFEIPAVATTAATTPAGRREGSAETQPIVMELHGSNFMFRAADRMNRKFKAKAMDDL